MEKQTRDAEMSDVTLAANLIRDVAGPRGHDEPIKVLWDRAYERLSRHSAQWTRRRVRALWAREAARVEHREIREMAEAIREQERLRDARKEHAEYLDRIARLETLLLTTDEDFGSHEIAALRGPARGMDST